MVRKLTMTAIIADKSAVCSIVKMASTIAHIHVNNAREIETERKREGEGSAMLMIKCAISPESVYLSSWALWLFLRSNGIDCHFLSLLRCRFARFNVWINCCYHVMSKRVKNISLTFGVIQCCCWLYFIIISSLRNSKSTRRRTVWAITRRDRNEMESNVMVCDISVVLPQVKCLKWR